LFSSLSLGRYDNTPSQFLDGLQALRNQLQKPVRVLSAHRCALHNAAVGGAPLSQHLRIAVDIALYGHDRRQMLIAAREAATGGIFGIVGTALGRVAGYFEKQLNFKQEQARWGHEYKLHELQMQARQQETELELALAAQAGSWKGLEASIKAEAAIGRASQWVINLLRLVRPVLTLFHVTRNGAIVEAAVFAASAATLWWFGDRAAKPVQKWGARESG